MDFATGVWMATAAYNVVRAFRILQPQPTSGCSGRDLGTGIDDVVEVRSQNDDVDDADRFIHYDELDSGPDMEFFRKNRSLLDQFECKTTRDCIDFFKFKLFCINANRTRATLHVGHGSNDPMITYSNRLIYDDDDDGDAVPVRDDAFVGRCMPTPAGGSFVECNPNSSSVKIIIADAKENDTFPLTRDVHGNAWATAPLDVRWECESMYPNVIRVNSSDGSEAEIACGENGLLVYRDDPATEWRNNKSTFEFNRAACKCRADDPRHSFLSPSDNLSCPDTTGESNVCHPGTRDPSDPFNCICPVGYVTCPQMKNFTAEFHELNCYGSYRAGIVAKAPMPVCIVDPCEPHGLLDPRSGKCRGKDENKHVYPPSAFHFPTNSFGVVLNMWDAPMLGTFGGSELWDTYNKVSFLK